MLLAREVGSQGAPLAASSPHFGERGRNPWGGRRSWSCPGFRLFPLPPLLL